MNRKIVSTLIVSLIALGLRGAPEPVPQAAQEKPEEKALSYLVQAETLGQAVLAVQGIGGNLTHELGVIRAVAATLTNAQHALLHASPGLRIYGNHSVELAGKPKDEGENCDGDCDGNGNGSDQQTFYPGVVDANLLHQQGIDGSGVAVAMIDTGIWVDRSLTLNASGQDRVSASYDAIQDAQIRPATSRTDDSGHGSHVTSVAISSRAANGKYNGLAPGADLVAVKAFDGNGHGTYADVIRGIGWVISKRSRYNIGVLNMSFSAYPTPTTGTTR